MITIIGISKAAIAVSKLDKSKYQLLLLFGDYIEERLFKGFETYLVGRKTLMGSGTGADMNCGKLAMEESLSEILHLIKGDEVIIVGYTGGGLAGGIATLVEGLLDQNKKVSVITSIPPEFEGPFRLKNSKSAIDNISKITNDIYIIDYNEVLKNLDKKETVLSFYKKCDDKVLNKILELVENNNIIFLDIDGVLNTTGDKNLIGNMIEVNKLNYLIKLVKETKSKIIVISSRRLYKEERDIIDNIFDKYEVIVNYLNLKPTHKNRIDEIKYYLSKNKIENYVILDDVDSGYSNDDILKCHYVNTELNGFLEEEYDKALNILKIKWRI